MHLKTIHLIIIVKNTLYFIYVCPTNKKYNIMFYLKMSYKLRTAAIVFGTLLVNELYSSVCLCSTNDLQIKYYFYLLE